MSCKYVIKFKVVLLKFVIKWNESTISLLFTLILAILIFLNGQNSYFAKHLFSFNTFKMVNSVIINYHSTTVKNHFRFFLSHKTLF